MDNPIEPNGVNNYEHAFILIVTLEDGMHLLSTYALDLHLIIKATELLKYYKSIHTSIIQRISQFIMISMSILHKMLNFKKPKVDEQGYSTHIRSCMRLSVRVLVTAFSISATLAINCTWQEIVGKNITTFTARPVSPGKLKITNSNCTQVAQTKHFTIKTQCLNLVEFDFKR
ncbi:pectin lyase-like superfamily protein [Striga asiatica]|uniref:Pectin lyase-like superfamily protein n=1 Tax=Striga asiatica TaxID=4170 RepID=A0A5A7PF70_STRAF|nr:pectin lyase-like superfamily protein [Striga asiatica]